MSHEMNTTKSAPLWPVLLILVLVIGFATIFFVLFFVISQADSDVMHGAENLTAETYMSEVDVLLTDADVEYGEELLTVYGCVACHVGAGAEHNLAPSFVGLADRAEERRLPLTASAYIYESIVYPLAYEVDGYSGQMPMNFSTVIPADDLGDIIAYLLTTGDNQS